MVNIFLRAPSLCGFDEESLVFVHEHQNFSSLATVISNTKFQNADEIQLGLRTFVLYAEQSGWVYLVVVVSVHDVCLGHPT